MAEYSKIAELFRGRDWRIWMGIGVTIIWIGAGIWYVAHVSETTPTQNFSLDAVGSFLEGVFAPLAFLWLVIGLFIQQRELAKNSEALRNTSEQSEKQTQAIAATEMNARQETFFKIAESVKHQLAGVSGMLFVSGLGTVGSGRFDRDKMDDLFARAGEGDSEIFARLFVSHNYEEEGGLPELFYATEIRQRHSRNFVCTYERLIRLARNCDVDGIIEDSLMNTAFGLLYRRMLDMRPEPEEGDTAE